MDRGSWQATGDHGVAKELELTKQLNLALAKLTCKLINMISKQSHILRFFQPRLVNLFSEI